MKTKTTKRLTVFLIFCLLTLMTVTASALETVTVYVTISDGAGKLQLCYRPVSVSDADKDGSLTMNDALICAHDLAYPGGSAKGYSSERGDYGLSMTRLWGTANGSGFGYQRNHVAAAALNSPVQNGDHVQAFVYTDTNNFSDTYCYFDRDSVVVAAGGHLSLKLTASGYDADWNPVLTPVFGAHITVDGVDTGVVTGEDGSFVLSNCKAGTHIISSISDTQLLVPPVCVLTVTGDDEHGENSGESNTPDTDNGKKTAPATGDAAIRLVFALAAIFTVGILCERKRRS